MEQQATIASVDQDMLDSPNLEKRDKRGRTEEVDCSADAPDPNVHSCAGTVDSHKGSNKKKKGDVG
jgi:hypothetical protein